MIPPPVPGRRLRWLAALAVLLVLAAAGAYAVSPLSRPRVVTGVSAEGAAVEAVYASGVVEYVRQVRLAPVVTAPIRAVLAAEDEAVRRGQVLARFEDGPQAATALQLEALSIQARAAESRARRLYEAGFGARAAYEDAATQRRAAEAAAASARARLTDYSLAAPFAGRVLRREAEPGDLAVAGTTLFVVADTTALRVTAEVDERDVARLAVGMRALVRADALPGRTIEGRITQITPAGDATARVFRVRVSVGAAAGLAPGMTVEVNLVTAERPRAVLVPTAALSGGAVWTLEDGRVHRRSVRTGAAGAERTEIRQGLKAGETVVLNPPADLAEGRRVRIARPAR